MSRRKYFSTKKILGGVYNSNEAKQMRAAAKLVSDNGLIEDDDTEEQVQEKLDSFMFAVGGPEVVSDMLESAFNKTDMLPEDIINSAKELVEFGVELFENEDSIETQAFGLMRDDFGLMSSTILYRHMAEESGDYLPGRQINDVMMLSTEFWAQMMIFLAAYEDAKARISEEVLGNVGNN